MDLLIASNTVTLDQADKAPASGTPGWATDGDPATGQLATDAPAWHYNMMMSELIAIIKAAGITPSNADWSQVLKAMQTIFSPAQYGVAPYSASLAQLVGGYPFGAIAFDASGNYWRSTKSSNITVPGVDGSAWELLFNGYATEEWAKGQFLQLALTTVQSVAGPVAFTGKTAVPDVSEFTGADALNAETAEGRYVKSVPAAGQTRITDLVENADGRAVFGGGTNNSVLALLSDLPMDDPAMKLQAFYVTPNYNLGANNPIRVSFPRSFKPNTVPVVMIPNTQEMGAHEYWISNVITGNSVNGATTELLVDNEGFSIGGYVIGAGIEGKAGASMIIPVFAAGYYA